MTNDPSSRVLLCREDIEAAVGKLAVELSRDYQDKNPVLIGVLTGSFIFLADLIRKLDISLEVDFIRVGSYGEGTSSSGEIRLLAEPVQDITGRNVLVIEDIVDTGRSLSFIMDYLRAKSPASLKLCTLADKPSRRIVPVSVDYTGVTIPDEFIVGYGFDHDEKYRNLPEICILDDTCQ